MEENDPWNTHILAIKKGERKQGIVPDHLSFKLGIGFIKRTSKNRTRMLYRKCALQPEETLPPKLTTQLAKGAD